MADVQSVNEYDSVAEILNEYDDNALKKLEEAGAIGDSYTQGSEWAAVIRAIKYLESKGYVFDKDLMQMAQGVK